MNKDFCRSNLISSYLRALRPANFRKTSKCHLGFQRGGLNAPYCVVPLSLARTEKKFTHLYLLLWPNIHLNIHLYICLSICWYANQPFYPYTYLVAHLTLIWKHAAICEKTTLETTFKSCVKKNFKYIPKHASFY